MPRTRTASRLPGYPGEVIVTLGVLVLLYGVWQVWWTDLEANAVHHGAVSDLEREFAAGGPPSQNTPAGVRPPTAAAARPKNEQPVDGAAYAIIRIPRLGPDYAVPVVEGTSRAFLERGIGHYQGTAQAGQVGNFALAGHRMTYGGPFRDIERVVPGDVVIVETRSTFYVYRMGKHSIVDPDHVAAIAPVPERPGAKPTIASITLTACHPKYASTWRWIVHGQLEAEVPRAEWSPGRYDGNGGA